jgi:hypothetical protein
VETLTGHTLLRTTQESRVYLAPTTGYADIFGWFNEKYPLPFDSAAPVVRPGEGCEIVATLTLPYTVPQADAFASIHSDPPGIATDIPAVTISRFGKGRVIWSALPLEAVPQEEYGAILLGLLQRTAPLRFTFETDAPADVELNAFFEENAAAVNAVSLWEERGTVPPFEVSIDTPIPKTVRLMPDGEELPFRYKDGRTVFQTQPLDIFAMYRIEW